MGKYYLCKKCKEVNDEELNAFITHVFHANYKSATNRAYLRSHSCGNGNYFNYEPQVIIKFHNGGIYKCMMDNYLKDDNGKLVYIGKLAGFLFEETKIDFHECEKIINAIEKHYGCSASVELFNCVDDQYITYKCSVQLYSVNGKCFASGCTISTNQVNGLLTAYRNARETLAKRGRLNEAIHDDIGSYIYSYKYF